MELKENCVLTLKDRLDIEKYSGKDSLKVEFSVVLGKLKVQFASLAKTLGAAIIAHATCRKARDVTNVLTCGRSK